MILNICPTRWYSSAYMQRRSNKSWNSRYPWYFTRHFRIQGKSYSFMPCRMVHLRHFETLEFWELWNLFKEWPPRTTLDALDNAYLATMKRVVLSKAFKQVAEKQTKIIVKRQLKALGSFSTRRNFPCRMIFSFVFWCSLSANSSLNKRKCRSARKMDLRMW